MRNFQDSLFLKGKAQIEVISALLIVGITMAAVSVAYLWGVPLIQKGQSTNQIQEAESVMAQIEKGIADVVQNGGQKSISLSLLGSLEISEDENSIKYSIITKKAGVARTSWVPLNDDETFGIAGTSENQSIPIYGTDRDAVLMAKATALTDGFVIDYRLAYRELDDLNSREGKIISISAVGNNKASAGNIKLSISRSPTVVLATPSRLGGKLTSTKVLLTIS